MGIFSTYGDRIAAIALGAGLLLAYLLVNPFELTSDVVATGLSSIPVTLLIFGVAGISKRSALLIGGGSTLGLIIGTYLQTAGLLANADCYPHRGANRAAPRLVDLLPY